MGLAQLVEKQEWVWARKEMYVCVCVRERDRVINTLSSGISIQDTSSWFAYEVIGKDLHVTWS